MVAAFGVAGAAGGGVRGAGVSAARDRTVTQTRLPGWLGAITSVARKSDATEELDKLQAEADDILRSPLTCCEHGAIEDGALTAFNIALEQFHNAVADRKLILMSLPQNLQRAGAQLRAAGS